MQALDIVVRNRNYHEAVSLGFMLGKRYFLRLWLWMLPLWLLVFVLVASVGGLTENWGMALLLFWWLRPLYEPIALLALSRLVFQPTSASVSRGDYMSALRAVWREVLWHRLGVGSRVCRQCVSLLEGLQGKARRDRWRFLAHQGQLGFAVQFGLSMMESVMIISVLLFIHSFLPDDWSSWMWRLRLVESPYFYLVLFVLSAVVASIGSVFFVSIGFALYLNQRIVSEGWAVALSLKALAEKVMKMVPMLLLVVMMGFAVNGNQAMASTVDSQQVMEAVLHEDKVSPLRQSYYTSSSERKTQKMWNWQMGEVSRVVVIVSLVFLVCMIGVMIWRRQRLIMASVQQNHRLVSGKSSADLSLVDIERLLAEGQVTEAIGALFRTGCVRLNVMKSDCERVCVLKAQAENTAVADFFATITRLWQRTAFAGDTPAIAEVQVAMQQFRQAWV